MSENYVVIMAGGSGTRFWPKSRKRHPKQFLAIGGSKSLLRQTAERVVPLVGWERLLVVTGAVHADHARSALPELPASNVLVEPTGRNTAPCIGWAAQEIAARTPGAKAALLPADHFIGDVPAFQAYLQKAFAAANGRIVLFGIVPTRPETGYGYIERGDLVDGEVRAVARFVEKPDRPTAETYLAAGTYLWNSGMFVFPVDTMQAEIQAHVPELASTLAKLSANPGDIETIYPTMPSISIDYAVMEKSSATAVIPASFAWSDVGSWDAAREVDEPDKNGNVVKGDARLEDSRMCYVEAEAGRYVALVGAEDLIVVDTKDAVLVARRGRSQDVKKIVEALKAAGREELL